MRLSKIRKSKLFKVFAVFVAINFLVEIFSPLAVYALTSGPASPEFSSFEPVVTTDMVNTFTGDFLYNLPVLSIPGADGGGGYSMSLSYHSGVTAEEEASWVGFGWTLNPGAINRNKRGFPDDYDDETITKYNKTRPNWTVSNTKNVSLEIQSSDTKVNEAGEKIPVESILSLNASSSIRFNNYMGKTRVNGYGLGVMGYGNLGMSVSGGEVTYSLQINPVKILSDIKDKGKDPKKKADYFKNVTNFKSWAKAVFKASKEATKEKAVDQLKSAGAIGLGSNYGLFNYGVATKATSLTSYAGVSYNWSKSLQINPAQLPIGVEGGHSGNVNVQANEPAKDFNVYGYLNNPDVSTYSSDDDVLSDYYVEKGTPYQKRDHFLGIPFNNADNFAISGEGISGGFRAYHDKVGHYYPNRATSKTKIRQMGIEFMIGANIGIGLDFGIGSQKTKAKNWKKEGNTDDYQFSSSSTFFRFNNDLGGKVDFATDAKVSTATLSAPGFNPPGVKIFEPDISSDVFTDMNENAGTDEFNQPNFSGRSSNIQEEYSSGLLSGFEIIKEDGVTYKYGVSVPVHSRKERGLQFDVSDGNLIRDNYLVYKDVAFLSSGEPDVTSSTNRTVLGESDPNTYANTFLIKQITSRDYVDVGNNGPDEADFGGWTKFDYKRKYGGGGDWYRWRMPYAGMFYSSGSLSEERDDLGTVASGEKEVYYVKAIETKTHVAFFITNKTNGTVNFGSYIPGSVPGRAAILSSLDGSGADRLDGLGAAADDNTSGDNAIGNENAKGNQQLEYLERIVLYSKARFVRPITTTHFQYNRQGNQPFTLARNLPNSTNGNYPNPATPSGEALSGKLTLERVWFEYEGAVNSRISPYVFSYHYENNYPQIVKDRYPEATAYGGDIPADKQNPDYSPHSLDAWGHHQFNGIERHNNMQPWLYQGKIPDAPPAFDPAAWQLKQIRLPSGGEIHIQYEQKDYALVQDKNAMAMLSLIRDGDPTLSQETGADIDDNKYYLNVEDIGLDPADANYTSELNQLKSFINSRFVIQGKRIYFKFLYALKGTIAGLNNKRSEYITGYCQVENVAIESVGGTDRLFLELGDGVTPGENVPRQVCHQFMITQREGKVLNNCAISCVPTFDVVVEDYYDYVTNYVTNTCTTCDFATEFRKDNDGGFFDKPLKKDLGKTLLKLLADELDANFFAKTEKDFEFHMNYGLSYLKIPMRTDKRGGGIRVKRLLMFDEGLETGDANLFGSEYIYQLENGRSSGVATNEPSSAREENPLVNILPRIEQSLFEKITVGKDRTHFEGPIGESILPAASVGHARVVIRNIHKGATGTGFAINEYFTTRDYPFDKYYTAPEIAGRGVDQSSIHDNTKKDFMNIPAGLINYKKNNRWVCQGYRFIVSSMSGQVKRMATYGGDFDDFNTLGKTYLSTSQEFQYFEPGDMVTMARMNNSGEIITYADNPGKEMDITMDMKRVRDVTSDFNVEVDIGIGLSLPPPITIGIGVSFSYTSSEISTHVTSKVVRYPAIVKRVIGYKDGSYNTTNNLAFNAHTGQPVLTQMFDGFHDLDLEQSTAHDGTYYSFTIPASWINAYSEMGQKAENSAYKNLLSETAGNVVSYGAGANPLTIYNTLGVAGATGWYMGGTPTPVGVIDITAQTFNKNWISSNPSDPIVLEYNISSGDLNALNSKWRKQTTFIFDSELLTSNATSERIYLGGEYLSFTNSELFNWNNLGSNSSSWLPANHVTIYSPNGNALEEENILGIFSAAKFGYNFTVPIIVAQNARSSAVVFEDYENEDASLATFDDLNAHSGNQALLLNGFGSSPLVTYTSPTSIVLDNQLFNEGGWLKLWLKTEGRTDADGVPLLTALVDGSSFEMQRVAQTGEWTLFELKITDWGSQAINDVVTLSISYNVGAAELAYVDDFRFQPLDAQMLTYVYDVNTLRLLTVFDDRHFGMFYQYDGEGNLVRRMIETERGLKTIQETQYNSPVIARN